MEHENKSYMPICNLNNVETTLFMFWLTFEKNLVKNTHKPFNQQKQISEIFRKHKILLNFETATNCEILLIIENMKGGLSPGFDYITVHILKSNSILKFS